MAEGDEEVEVILLELECPLCTQVLGGLHEDALQARYQDHLENECVVARFLRGLPKGTRMGDVYYLLKGRYPKGYKKRVEAK